MTTKTLDETWRAASDGEDVVAGAREDARELAALRSLRAAVLRRGARMPVSDTELVRLAWAAVRKDVPRAKTEGG